MLGIATLLAAGALGGAAAHPAEAVRPPIVQRPIPYGSKRTGEMAAYAKRHYGIDGFRLRDPKVIVVHYTANSSFRATFDTFAPDRPDVELHELPGLCSHFVVDTDGTIYQLVSISIMCRHTVGLNYTAIGVENVGTSAGQIFARPAQLRASTRLVAWLRCREGIGLKNVIGHAESLSSPYHRERVASLKRQTHADFDAREMRTYRAALAGRACP